MKTSIPKKEATADRIISAAGAVFAERGFRGTTIRQITARAGVNVAAVNYHFRDKNELYIRVLRSAKLDVVRIAVAELTGTPKERLRDFIARFVSNLLSPERPTWQSRVIAMEMANPTPALGVILRELTGPLFNDVRELVREIVGPRVSQVQLDLFTLSIFGQCIFYVSSRPAVERLAAHLNETPDRSARIAEHIANFSLAGLDAFRKSPDSTRHAKTTKRPRIPFLR